MVTTLAVSETAAIAEPYRPESFSGAMQLAETFYKSGLVPGASNKEHVFMLLATGHELGLSPTQATRGLYATQGRVGMYADTMVAILLRRSDVCERWEIVESNDESCTIETKRKSMARPVRLSWTIEQAKAAGYCGGKNANWRSIPQTMLRHRCAAFLARQVYPDLILGLYDRDELEDLPPTQTQTQTVQSSVVSSVVSSPITGEVEQEDFAELIAESSTLSELESVAMRIKNAGFSPAVRTPLVAIYKARKDSLTSPVIATVVPSSSEDEHMREPGQEG